MTKQASRPRGRRRRQVDVPRLAAWFVLKTVRTDDAYANLVLPAVHQHYRLDTRDAAFVTELASQTLRRRGSYDAIVADCSERALSKIDPGTLDALRLGVHQLLGMRVPDHAAISTTVDLVADRMNEGAAKFANAVLRKVTERSFTEWIEHLAGSMDDIGRLELEHSHPRWVVEELTRALPESELAAHLASNNEPPAVTLVARPGRVERDELPGSVTPFSPYGVRLESGAPGDLEAVREGRAAVQDEGSQLVAAALAEAPLDGPDDLWLDLCAGPGGKAALLGALAGQRASVPRVVGTELAPHRAELVARTAGSDVGVVAADGMAPPLLPSTVDRLLLDAPCTGLGALRRRPESRWRRKPDSVLEMVLIQQKLLDSAMSLVRPGGLVMYATCSPVVAETSALVRTWLRKHPEAELVDLRPRFEHVPDCAGALEGTIQLWPHRHGTDAMYLALLRRTE